MLMKMMGGGEVFSSAGGKLGEGLLLLLLLMVFPFLRIFISNEVSLCVQLICKKNWAKESPPLINARAATLEICYLDYVEDTVDATNAIIDITLGGCCYLGDCHGDSLMDTVNMAPSIGATNFVANCDAGSP